MKKWISFGFMILIMGVAVIHVVVPDESISISERRKLASFPTISFENVWNGTMSDEIENYLLDQFPQRDAMRKVQSLTEQVAFKMPDVNGYYQIGDGIYEVTGGMQESYIQYAADGFSRISDQYFPNANIYYAIIPDKNYFVAEENGYPSLSYQNLIEIVKTSMEQKETRQYIDLFQNNLLSIDDYYRTDLHWKQECILPVVEKLADEMKVDMNLEKNSEKKEQIDMLDYQKKNATNSFQGSYYGASAFLASPDTIQYLEQEQLQACSVYDYEKQKEVPMYQFDRLEGVDAYDFYLGGARALLRIENPNQDNGRKLVMFRDSFGSSIAPLLLPYYEEIIMIDLRYTTMSYCVQQIDIPEDSDILFLYNADMLNHGNSLRF